MVHLLTRSGKLPATTGNYRNRHGGFSGLPVLSRCEKKKHVLMSFERPLPRPLPPRLSPDDI